jgi:hypothetical protein
VPRRETPATRRPRGGGARRGGAARKPRAWETRLGRAFREELFQEVAPVDVLFLSRTQDHTETFADGLVDRIIDPIIWLARREGLTTLKVILAAEAEWRDAQQVEPSLMLSSDQLQAVEKELASSVPGARQLTALRRRFGARRARREIRPLLEAVTWRLGECTVPDTQVTSAVRRINSLSCFFGALLDKARPRLVVLGVFYALEAMALTHACRQRGIPVVDIQHGKQGRFHGMYDHWSVLPHDGYSVLPDIFWNWGAESAETIRSSLPPGTCRPTTVIGGNCWLSAWKGNAALACLPETEALLQKMTGYERTILVSLQPLGNPIPAHVLQAMKQAPHSWLWLVRLHPHQRREAATIEAQLSAAQIASFDVTEATNAPLYPLLSRVDAQVTCWSSVAYEALAFGKAVILVHPLAKTLYSAYIEQGYFSYAGSTEALLERLFAATGDVANPEKEPYIETGEARAREALAFCLDFGAGQAPAASASLAAPA